jgi:hypothetical protein
LGLLQWIANDAGETSGMRFSARQAAKKILTGGDIVEGDALTNSGTFNIQCNNSISGLGGIIGFAQVANTGTLIKRAGVGTTTVGVPFANAGVFDIASGIVDFTSTSKQTAGTASTTLEQTTTLKATGGNYQVLAGNFYSDGGTVTGTLENVGGTVSAQTAARAPSSLVINGDYIQGAGGTLLVIAALNRTSTMSVDSVGGVGGTTTLNGTVAFDVEPAFLPDATPAGGTAFLRADALVGGFANWVALTPGWTWNGRFHQFEAPIANNTEYDMNIS